MNEQGVGREYMMWWTEEQFAYFCAVRERLRLKFIERGLDKHLEHYLNVAGIQEMQKHGILKEVRG